MMCKATVLISLNAARAYKMCASAATFSQSALPEHLERIPVIV